MSDGLDTPARTRRQFVEAAAAAAALTVLARPGLASGQAISPPPPVPQPPAGPTAPFGTYQSEIYVAGMSANVDPIFTTNLVDLRAAAEEVMSAQARRNLLAAAGGEQAVRANVRAMNAWRIVPRMFLDRSERSLAIDLLGVEMSAPIILGPVPRQALVHPEGELASARAAAGLGLTYVHSSEASQPVEAVAATAPQGSRWFAIDWPDDDNDPDLTALVRAQAAGCTHLVVSAPQPGRGWRARFAISEVWSGPIILSGVQAVPTARNAIRRGFDAIVVSNEAGRRGTAPKGTIDQLPKIAKAVGGKIPILFGSGVISAPDVYRALGLGADAVFVGRPYVHGLALAGEDGVRHMLRTLLAQLEIDLAIAAIKDHRRFGGKALIRD